MPPFDVGQLAKHTKTGGIYRVLGQFWDLGHHHDCDVAYLVCYPKPDEDTSMPGPLDTRLLTAYENRDNPNLATDFRIPVFIQTTGYSEYTIMWTLYQSRENGWIYARPKAEFEARFTHFAEKQVAI